MNRSPKWPVMYVVIGSLWAIAMCVWAFFPMMRTAFQSGTSCTSLCQATVIAYDDEGATSHTDILHYTVSGVTYVTRVPGVGPGDFGKIIPVHYNPQNPGQAYIGDEKSFSLTPYFAFMAVFALGAGLLIFIAYSHAMKDKKHCV